MTGRSEGRFAGLPTTWPALPLSLCVGLLPTGCGARPSDADAELTDLPIWVLENELRIGSLDDPDEGFSRVRDMKVHSDGLVYVLEGQERQIRVFDESGARIRTIGGRGNGPGELENPDEFGLVGDTLWVGDTNGNQRITLFSTDGTLIGTVRAPPIQFTGRTGAHAVMVVPTSLQPDGTFLSEVAYALSGGLESPEEAVPHADLVSVRTDKSSIRSPGIRRCSCQPRR